jgi:hypothetical protein
MIRKEFFLQKIFGEIYINLLDYLQMPLVYSRGVKGTPGLILIIIRWLSEI